MAFERTLTEHELDGASTQTLQRGHGEMADHEPDLAVDGLSDSVLARLLRLFRLA